MRFWLLSTITSYFYLNDSRGENENPTYLLDFLWLNRFLSIVDIVSFILFNFFIGFLLIFLNEF